MMYNRRKHQAPFGTSVDKDSKERYGKHSTGMRRDKQKTDVTLTIDGKGTITLNEDSAAFDKIQEIFDLNRKLSDSPKFLDNTPNKSIDWDGIITTDSSGCKNENNYDYLEQKSKLDSLINDLKKVNLNRVSTVTSKDEDSSANITLGKEQKALVDLVVNEKRSIFFTGSAGTGKSVVLKEMIKKLKKMYPEPGEVAVTASTGLAALNIGGKTYHSHFGIGLGTGSAEDIYEMIKEKKDKSNNWIQCKVLVIDEISMVENRMITKLSEIAQLFRNNKQPFGGIQVVFCGDFFQLPPVIRDFNTFKSANGDISMKEYNSYKRTKYAFMSPEWKRCLQHEVTLTEVHRQKTDPGFVKMLNEVRVGNISLETDMAIQELSRDLENLNGVEPATLYPTRREAIEHNNAKLRSLKGRIVEYTCAKGGTLKNSPQFASISNSFLAPDKLNLKIGAQVMLIRNQNKHLVNGSLGTVIDFVTKEDIKRFQLDKTLPKGCYGKLEKEPYYKQLTTKKSGFMLDMFPTYPVVKFVSPLDPKKIDLFIVLPAMFEFLEYETNKRLVYKIQLPLNMAWALSVHKSQGQTYSYVSIDLAKTFEEGQAYVALSRVTNRNGLQVLGWHKAVVKVNSEVKTYCKNIQTLQ